VTKILLIPGLGGPGPNHWQSRWEKSRPGCSYIAQSDWNIPDHHNWVNSLDTAVRACSTPPVLVAHSLGCAMLAHWASQASQGLCATIRGALMVAPGDVDSETHTAAEAKVFAPMPLSPLAFPTIVVASSNDPYVDLHRAQHFATAWGAELINIGACGHINANSRLGNWDQGWGFLDAFTGPASVTDATLSRA